MLNLGLQNMDENEVLSRHQEVALMVELWAYDNMESMPLADAVSDAIECLTPEDLQDLLPADLENIKKRLAELKAENYGLDSFRAFSEIEIGEGLGCDTANRAIEFLATYDIGHE
ncbi:MAG TPA: hypothetical protein V6C65_04095 [Allocoleopsis sp.]